MEIPLESIGLTKNEGKVYLTLLKTGTSKTGNLLKNSGLNSGKIYEILDSLKRKGLISETELDGTRHFSPSRSTETISRAEKERDSKPRKGSG
jgi:sugar-specific transcriptional regulator TrmB